MSPNAVPFRPSGWGVESAGPVWPVNGDGQVRTVTAPAVNFTAAGRIQERVAERLTRELPGTAGWTEASRRERARALIVEEVAGWALDQTGLDAVAPSVEVESAMSQAVFAAMFGLGRLAPLLTADVENVDANGCDDVWVERAGGRLERGPALADSDRELVELIQRFARDLGQTSREFSTAHPLLNLRLPVTGVPLGARLAATMDVAPRPQLSIRIHRHTEIVLEDLYRRGTISLALLEFLRAAVRAKKTIGMTGPMGCGKTTTTRALAAEFPRWQRIATIETEFELGLHLMERHPRVYAVEMREATADSPNSGVGLADLIPHGLRHNTRRQAFGEVRGAEIVYLLDTVANGSSGALFTLHGRRGGAAIDRMVELATREGLSEVTANRLISGTVDFLVHMELHEDLDEEPGGEISGRRLRFVDEVLEIKGRSDNGGGPAWHLVFKPGTDGRAVPDLRPACLEDLMRVGLDPAWWDSPDGGWHPDVPGPGAAW